MQRFKRAMVPLLAAAAMSTAFVGLAPAQGNTNPKLTWHWHVHQPIYWNGQNRNGGVDRYEYAWDSIQQKDNGSPHPTNNLRGIFGLDDRIAAYQYRMRDALATFGDHAKSGVVVSYSGALMQNVRSLGLANQLGFSPSWKNGLAEANSWTTTNGYSRLEFTNFSFHHGLTGLLPDEANYMSIRLQQEMIRREFGDNAVDRGFFPTEMTWSVRLIPVLKRLNIDWSIVSGEHIARACPDFPIQFGQGGIGCDPPNKADQINPNGEQFIRTSIQRGVAPVNANPMSYQPAYQKWVNPETGEEQKLIVVPADQGWGWLEGYGQVNAQMLTDLMARNNPSQPSLVLMSHDGDNAYAGGYSYYMENLRNLANDARSRGGEVTSISQYLHDFPPSTSSVIHVEDGGWVNADGDFGSPSYINWNYPLLDQAGNLDPANGWHEKVREMAIFHETLNKILTAEQLTPSYTRNFAKILEPDASTHAIDRAWHYYLGSFDSGNVYYGNVEDFSIKGTLGALKVDELIGGILSAGAANDDTPPTIFVPQRFPYNPGSLNFGVAYASSQYQGRQFIDDGDFTIWTFVADVSGPPTAVLKYRIDNDGTNPLSSNENETFAGGSGVGNWQSISMTGRAFPRGDVYDRPDVNYSLIGGPELLPSTMPWHFSAEVKDLRSVLIDYYVEATDSLGNVSRSAIQHVFIGDGSGATGGGGGNGNDVATISPDPAVRGQNVTVTYDSNGRNLAGAAQVYMHYGKNNYAGGAVSPDATMTNAGNGLWTYTYTVPADATSINMVFNNGSGTWDNNGGANWNFSASEATGPLAPVAAFSATPLTGNAPLSVTFTDSSTNGPTSWEWDFETDGTADSTTQNPTHVYTSPGTYTVTLTATNSVGSDDEAKSAYIVVTAPPTDPELTLNKSTIAANTAPGGSVAPDTFTVRNTGGGTLNYTVARSYDGFPTPPTPQQVLTALTTGSGSSGMDANGDGVVDAADVIKAQIGVPGPAWLTVNPTSGSATTETDTINVTYDATGLQEGTYNATITVSGNAANSPRTVPVTLTIAAVPPPTIGLSTNTITQSAPQGGSANPSTFTVSNAGGGSLDWTATEVDLGDGVGWLSVMPISGTSTGAPSTVTINYTTAGLEAGSYQARIDFSANGATNSPQSVDVTLTILESVPTTTTVSPNPPVAGQAARVWYASTAGPIGGRANYNLYWGINGGLTQGGTWLSVTTTAMTNAQQNGIWYADITIPESATSLNFVFNDGNNTWDNNGGADWNYAVTPVNVGNAVMTLNPDTVTVSLPQGASATTRTVALGNSGTSSLTWTSTVNYLPVAKSVAKATGSRKTITIDGTNTAGEWTANELVVSSPAWDHANVVGGNWSTHETQLDYTALYAAWDASNLYVGIQMVDVVDVEDPANAGSSQGTAPVNMNLPQFLAINTRAGGYGNPAVLSDMWTKKHGFSGTDQPDYQVYFASNFWQGPFLCEYQGGWDPDNDAYGPPGQIYQDAVGLDGASAKADAGAPIIGPGGKNYRTSDHNTSRDSFFELAIPLNLIGNPDLDNASIGLFVGHGEGFSGVDTIPVDPAATNTPGVSQSNSPNEWEDEDVYTVPFAKVGAGEALGGGQDWLSVSPAQGTVAAAGSTDLTLSVNPENLEPGVYTAEVDFSGNSTNSPLTATVTLTVTGTGADPIIQVSGTSVSATGTVGTNAASRTFTIRNSGVGTLDYTITKSDTGNGTDWLSVSPASGTSTGENDTITVNFANSALAAGDYSADLVIAGNATNSPQTVTVNLAVQASIPSTTTVVPNPPVAGAAARVWYASGVGPISGRTAYNLYWAINGGADGTAPWQGVTTTAMVNAQQGGMWYADITVPAGATSLNFVFNDGNGNWDNNSNANWNFLTATSNEPLISLSTNAVNASTTVGGSAASQTFTVRNLGGGTLNYTIAESDTGSGLNWLSIDTTSGSSTGEADTVTVTFDSASLALGSYTANLVISGNATNSPQAVTVTLSVQTALPTTTTVVPNPPVAGAGARIWYASASGSISGRTAYNAHWGINGGADGQAGWESVTSTPLVNSGQGGMWYADITIPAGATSLNFVFNDGNNNWDNNNGANWNFLTAVASEPVITLSTNSVNATANVGATPANSTFTVRNGGANTLNYTVTKVDTGDGVAFLNVSPASGSSTGEADTVTITWNTSGLSAGTYVAGIQVAGNATNSPAVVTATVTIGTPGPVVRPITIGRGPSIGTNTEGTQYYEEFQDWNANDLRALDTNDAVAQDGYDGSRDLVALYSRLESNNLYLRLDLLELGILAEQGNADLYVLIDCASGGSTTLPNGIGGTTTDAWDLAVATYDATNFGVIRSNGQAVAGAHLGAYWRSDLDSVEFGVTQQALRDAGWDGTSAFKLMAFSAKDFATSVSDNIGFAGGIPSTNKPGRAKFATIAHGNQSLNRGDGMRDRIYKSAATTGVGAPSGFRLTLDTHRIFQVPINIHMSATLISAIHWIEDANPVWDGDAFIDYVGTFVDEDQSSDPGALIGGVFSEHIMPFFTGPVNINSIARFDDLTTSLWGIDGTDMEVMHVPERVINSVAAASGRDVFDDIVDSPYRATYLDEVAHIRNWLYPNDNWTGIGGEYGIPRQHKIMLINGVYTFQINDNEDQYKFWPQDGGANMNWRTNLLYKALDTDQEQLTLIFDDWEALAGYSFGSGYNNNAVQYNDVMRWVANHPWIEVVTLKDILHRATNTSHPQYSSNWVVSHGDIGNKPFDTYDYLHHATEDSYANWYNGSAQEESFRNAVPVTSGTIGSGTAMPSGKVFGELGTSGTIIHDTWAAVQAAPSNSIRRLAERAYQAMIYETAWHDEDNTNYERTPGSNYKQWTSPDTTYDRVSGWAFTLHNHLRGITITTAASQWVESVKTGSRPAGVSVTAIDLDQDGESEYVLSNERLWLAFERRGGRCVQAYYYDPSIQDGISFIGTSPINNPTGQGEEEGGSTASRCSGFKEMNNNAYADVVYTAATGSNSVTFTSPNGQVIKTLSLTAGSNVLTASYTNNTGGDLYVRMGVSVNNLDLLDRGQNFSSNYTTNGFTQTNNTRGSLTITGNGGVTTNQLDTFTRFVIPLTEQMELRIPTGSQSFTLTVPN